MQGLRACDVMNIDPKWDVPEYALPGDEYSAHVHPPSWKIHGWVDDRICDWMIADGVKIGFHTGMVEPDWTGTWQGVTADSALSTECGTQDQL